MVFLLQAVITLNKHIDVKQDTNLMHWKQEKCVQGIPSQEKYNFLIFVSRPQGNRLQIPCESHAGKVR